MKEDLKLKLYKTCEEYLQKRLNAIENRLNDIRESLAAETKSSAGDKYETGRAMLHLEKDKQMTQLASLLTSKKILNGVPHSNVLLAEQGALVKTNHGNFYIAISAGKLIVNKQTYFSITLASPIGKLLFQKKAGDSFDFRGKNYILEEVS
jgi:hypothetical protein